MTRTFAVLDHTSIEGGILTLRGAEAGVLTPEISIKREGTYVVLAAGVGFVEVALRLHYAELQQMTAHLQPNDGLTTSRQVGTGEAYLAIGLKTDGTLILRPVVVGDASGHLRMNFKLTSDARAVLLSWIAGGG
ncbi:MAG: hypothetical protein SGJ24_19150 [Chloroflexota bacterium]|nr:hypothetical protein [Chloroflexota bacterium]